MSSRCHRHRPLHHLLVLCALLLATLVQPVLASVADVHEATHAQVDHGRHDHAADSGQDAVTDAAQSTPGEDESGSFLHALASANHCCGHAVAITSTLPRLLPALVAGNVSFALPTDPTGRVSGGLFRPPIQI